MKRPPTIPVKAKAEIAEVIVRDGHINNRDLDAILKKYRVAGDTQALQRGYRLRAAQRFLAGFRDEDDHRKVLSYRDPDTRESAFIHIDLCNDESKLYAIQARLHKVSSSLQMSSDKVSARALHLAWLKKPFELVSKNRKRSHP